jgi:hypothetical protein
VETLDRFNIDELPEDNFKEALAFIVGHVEGAHSHTTFPFPKPVRKRNLLHFDIKNQISEDVFDLLKMGQKKTNLGPMN